MTKKTFFNFTLFDGTNDQNDADAWFTVDTETGRLVNRGHGTPEATDEQVDLNGQYVMPGFFNVHTHVSANPLALNGSDDSESETAVFAWTNLQSLLKSGVTYVRGCGNDYDVDVKLKKLQKSGQLPHTPHMLTSGKAFSMTGGHGDSPHGGHAVDSPDEMRKAVRTAFKNGAESIKVMATGGVMTPNDFMEDAQLSVAEMHVAVEEAHHKRRVVAAHAEGNPGIQNALDAGVDSIEHGFYVNEQEAHQMVQQGTYLTPTLIAEWVIPEFGKGELPDWEVKKAADALDDTYVNMRRAFKLGVKFTCGTDAGTPYNGFDKTPEEFGLLTKLGMTPAQAYQCSSLNSAQLLGVADDYGTLEVGKFADFQVLKNDPLADTANVVQADKQVYLGGHREF
ncbi:amidohydrolase [Levilactobacillus zymae]|uniref:Amidohydrolase n=1 Tax=Levilactobacillus zymae TaxID=267363 RepID=A0ABQ0WX61_9LACO|nr:amidohydrolase family protein [Levilactobacillus zymae]KRL10821.1 imidazolonepropionase related amidohydrolase [Levilactobacillus zymae DSM 19395]QFR61847.1 amidohydrolase family protein [Levilactobacillus zymae]GEO72460.1 amidohydrolase [Levilactobacillus zymae]